MCRWVTSKHFISIAWVDLDLFKRLEVACEIRCIIPAHRVDVRLSNFLTEGRVGSGEIAVEVFELQKALLLDNLCVDVRRSHCSDL